jgi:hypothetical protein
MSGDPYEFVSSDIQCRGPELARMTTNHFLVTFQAESDYYYTDARAKVLEIDTSDWSFSTPGSDFQFTFDRNGIYHPVYQIDTNNYLVFVTEEEDPPPQPGFALVLNANPITGSIFTSSNAFQFYNSHSAYPEAARIDSDHYLLVHRGSPKDCRAQVIEIKEHGETCP